MEFEENSISKEGIREREKHNGCCDGPAIFLLFFFSCFIIYIIALIFFMGIFLP